MRLAASFLGTLLISSTLSGDLIGFPDDLISGKGETKLELGVNYGNGTYYNCSDLLSCTRSNTDSLTWTPGLRYGINSQTEIYGRASWYSLRSHDTNILSLEETKSEHDRFSDLWIGVNHRIWNDAITPGLLVFFETAAMENVSLGSHTDWVYGKTFVAGATLYRSIDPIILSATASYRYSRAREIPDLGDATIDPGDSILFNPSISFAANNEVSITSGFQWQRQQGFKSDFYNGHTSTRTDLTLGMGYMWSDALTFHVSTSTDMTGDGGSSISMLALYTLGKETKQPTPSPIAETPKTPSTLTSNTETPKSPVVAAPLQNTPPKTIITQLQGDKKQWFECTRISQGWDKEILQCESIDEIKASSNTTQNKSFSEEVALGQEWIKKQNPKYYTLEISIHSIAQASLLLDHLSKTRVSYSQPSHLHPLSSKKGAIALGSFKNRQEALDFLNTLQFVTDKSNSLLRTFGGLTKELHSLK